MLRLYKKEKLCNCIAIDALFAKASGTSSSLAFPIRAVWRLNQGRKSDAPMQFMVSVPKKRLRHAVDRVTMRRRMREAYRLCHQQYALPEGARVDVAFVYVDNSLQPYARVDKAMHRLLAAIAKDVHEQHVTTPA